MTTRRALLEMAVLAVVAFLLQPAAALFGDWYSPRLELVVPGGATSLQWGQIVKAQQTPDVVFVGDSRARTDVDAERLSAATGRSVGRLGPNGADMTAEFLAVDRLLRLPSRPRLVVVAVTQFQFNAGYRRDFTPDYWQLDRPLDLGFAIDVTALDPAAGRFVAGTLLPLYANLPVIAHAADCLAQTVGHRSGCAPAGYASDAAFFTDFRQSFLRGYAYSSVQQDRLERLLDDCRRAGVAVAMVTFPERTDEITPADYSAFLGHMHEVAARHGVDYQDLHGWRPATTDGWDDPIHLSSSGRGDFTPVLAGLLARGATRATSAAYTRGPW